jgi:hypothetical protein
MRIMEQLNFDQINIFETILENKALKGLAYEWEQITGYYINEPELELMRLPAFELSDMTNTWAYWNRELHKMTFSRKLISNYSWADIVNVLKHEIAHQYADTILHAYKHETSHGPLFRQACQTMRIDHKATLDLILTRNNPGSTKEDRVVAKVHKLLSLASSNNENEANNAMIAAQKLIESYNIDIIKNDQTRQFDSKRIGKTMSRRPRYMYRVAYLLTMFYHVKTIWETTFCLNSEKKGNALCIIGSKNNLEIAEYVHDFVHHYIDTHWLEAKRKTGTTAHKKNDFASGVVNGFIDKIKQANEDTDVLYDRFEITRVTDPQLDDYFQYLYPRTQTIRRKSRSLNRTLYNHGLDKGKDLVIHKGVQHQNGNRMNLLN